MVGFQALHQFQKKTAVKYIPKYGAKTRSCSSLITQLHPHKELFSSLKTNSVDAFYFGFVFTPPITAKISNILKLNEKKTILSKKSF